MSNIEYELTPIKMLCIAVRQGIPCETLIKEGIKIQKNNMPRPDGYYVIEGFKSLVNKGVIIIGDTK